MCRHKKIEQGHALLRLMSPFIPAELYATLAAVALRAFGLVLPRLGPHGGVGIAPRPFGHVTKYYRTSLALVTTHDSNGTYGSGPRACAWPRALPAVACAI